MDSKDRLDSTQVIRRMDHQGPEFQQRPRKRARLACNRCHDRKVRCDVSVQGTPCTNCRLDSCGCVVRSNTSKRRIVRNLNLRPAPTKENNELVPSGNPSRGSVSIDESVLTKIPFHDFTSSASSIPTSSKDIMPTLRKDNEGRIEGPKTHPLHISKSIPDPDTAELRGGSNIIFSFYRFLELRDLPSLPPEDVKFLELKGCLHVPTGPILDEFVRQYFLHVHPCLPVIDEAQFWQMYSLRGGGSGRNRSISLFIFQAMLFASCAFVSPSTIKKAGYPDTRTARNTLYRRAKLLFDLKAENDTLTKAQGAVLLTYQCASIDLHAGCGWLTTAIQNAMATGAHSYRQLNVDDPLRGTKKRLWWSILLRDRIMPLGLRRHLQITPGYFDLALDTMSEEDLRDEIYQSAVYDFKTKKFLAKVLNVQCQLALKLTRPISIVYAPGGFRSEFASTEEFAKELEEIEATKDDLAQWASDASAALSPILSLEHVHESVTLYTDLTYIYYHTARIALCHHETLLIEAHQARMKERHPKRLESIRDELENATRGVTKRMKQFMMKGIARHLPISAIAYTALPLLLSALDVKFSSNKSHKSTREHRLNYYTDLKYYTEAMRLYRSRYCGTDDVVAFIQRVLQFAEMQGKSIYIQSNTAEYRESDEYESAPTLAKSPSAYESSDSRTRNWCEIFVRHPRFYLRLCLSLDYAFARGKYPEENELPLLVREFNIEDSAVTAANTTGMVNSSVEEATSSVFRTQSSPKVDEPVDSLRSSDFFGHDRTDESPVVHANTDTEQKTTKADSKHTVPGNGDMNFPILGPLEHEQAGEAVNLDFLELGPCPQGALDSSWSYAMFEDMFRISAA